MPDQKPPRADELFPLETKKPEARTFELGLVLGGTVSAGAYTAGALDFLLEALEAWNSNGPPKHKVVLTTVGGSSGGAVCSAILGLLSNRTVPHIKQDLDPDRGPGDANRDRTPTGNPLWDLWVSEFRMSRLVSDGDLHPPQNADEGTGADIKPVQHVPSLLNCEMINTAGRRLAKMGPDGGSRLPYFAAPFRIAVTVANLRGVPHKVLVPQFGDFSGVAYVQHDDFAWFAFPNGALAAPSSGYVGKREDEFWLSAGDGIDFTLLDTLVAYATASGAMPVGLAARALTRPAQHYLYRPMVRPLLDQMGQPTNRICWPRPDWTYIPEAEGGTYAFTAVDGGTFNNDPFTLVHRAMAGLIGENPQGRSDASRAILMIDPLADQPRPIARTGKSLVAVVESIVSMVVGGARYLTADMDLFANEDVFSRFQLVPERSEKGKIGETALAGTSLYAAGGWCSRRFRVHDYLLGRQNMQNYLRTELVLAGDNPLFDGWDDGMRADWAMDDAGKRVSPVGMNRKDYFLPIIPDQTGGPLAVPDWPSGAFDPADLEDMLEGRLTAVVRQLIDDNGGGGLLPWILGVITVPGVASFIASKITDKFTAELKAAGLWT